MQKNVAGQKIGVQMVSATDGSAFTGSVTVYVTGDAGTQSAGSVGSGACTHEGNGYHTYAPAQAESNYDLIAFTFTGTGAVPATVQVYTRHDANVTQWLGTAPATPTVAGVPEVDLTHINGGTNGVTGIDSAGNHYADDGAFRATDASGNAVATADAVAALPSAASIATTLLDLANGIETGMTPREALRLLTSALAGILSGAGTDTEVFRNAVANSKTRITATVDASGNRNAIVTDLT